VAPKVYLETSVISYLTARPARDVVVLAHQQLTREWWVTERQSFELYTSEIVLAEAERGDADAARARVDVLRATQQLAASAEAERLVPVLLRATGLPPKALADMSHIALATVHGMHFLLTWNCKHIANANVLRTVAKTCRAHGYELPVICTPEELMGNRNAG
jgi:predicted nucleic acid-binding protein